MNDLLTPEPTEPSAEEGSTLNSQLLRLRGAADSMHTALLVWENHIDHPGARTAIHSAARVLLDAASAMPTHYDDAEVRAQALREAAEVMLKIKSPFHWQLPTTPKEQGTTETPPVWLRSRADLIKQGGHYQTGAKCHCGARWVRADNACAEQTKEDQ